MSIHPSAQSGSMRTALVTALGCFAGGLAEIADLVHSSMLRSSLIVACMLGGMVLSIWAATRIARSLEEGSSSGAVAMEAGGLYLIIYGIFSGVGPVTG